MEISFLNPTILQRAGMVNIRGKMVLWMYMWYKLISQIKRETELRNLVHYCFFPSFRIRHLCTFLRDRNTASPNILISLTTYSNTPTFKVANPTSNNKGK